MNNDKKTVHASGPLAALLQSNQIKNHTDVMDMIGSDSTNKSNLIIETKSGIKFSESELIEVDPNQCTPWKYANRDESELGDLESLMQSIKQNKQLQPALIRPVTDKDSDYKYEVIFGRRRLLACQKLGIKLLAICKQFKSDQEAISIQDAENKYRNDVSDYSNAKLYRKLIDDGIFKSEGQLAKKLNMSTSSLSDLMSFNKIPQAVIEVIPDIHTVSRSLSLRMCKLAKEYGDAVVARVAAQVGSKINSATELEKHVKKRVSVHSKTKAEVIDTKKFRTADGKSLFTLKHNSKGNLSITFAKDLSNRVNLLDEINKFAQALEHCGID